MPASPDGAVLEPRRRLALLTACPYLFVGDAGPKGQGVFTARPRRAGEILLVDEDGSLWRRALPLAAALAQGWDRRRELFQLDADLFLPPRGSFDDLFNHACDPSGGWQITPGGARFIAIRDLAAGDELTYDYSCHLLSRDEQMVCACGCADCRGTIGPFDMLPTGLQRRYRELGVVSPAVLRSAA